MEFIPDASTPIFLTESAVKAAKEAISAERAGAGLRVSIVGGGCSGYQYNLDYEHESREGDTVMEFNGLTVYLDGISAGYLSGTTVDFISGIHGTGFKFNNPNVRSRCCGCASQQPGDDEQETQ